MKNAELVEKVVKVIKFPSYENGLNVQKLNNDETGLSGLS